MSFKKQLHCVAFAPAKKVPAKYGFKVHNLYSEEDGVTGRWASEQDGLTYNVEMVKCLSPRSITRGLKEHSFLGPTLQKGLKDQIEDIRKERKFFHGNTR